MYFFCCLFCFWWCMEKIFDICYISSWVGSSGICIIFAPPRTGKTALLTAIGNHYAFDRERNKAQQNEISILNQGGFNIPFPIHCVRSNYSINFKKHKHSMRKSRKFRPFHYGFKNDFVDTDMLDPYDVLLATEGQKYWNSRKSKNYPAWQSRKMEQIGHDNILMFIDVQRPILIDVNIRELAKFIEVVKMQPVLDKDRQLKGFKWYLKLIDNSFLLDTYLASGKKIEVPEIVVFVDYDVFKLYESKCCRPRFYEGHFADQPDESVCSDVVPTIESFKQYLLDNKNDDVPDGFYEK